MVIHHTFAPLGDKRQRQLVLRLSYAFGKYQDGPSVEALRRTLQEKFQGTAFLFGSNRDGILAILRAIKEPERDEVIIQGYTCVVLPNAIHAAGMKPVYADIEKETLNLSVETIKSVLTPRTRAVIVQHTFGIAADTHALRALCDEHKIALIEDCAHVMPDSDGPSEIAGLGDVIVFSFGRDKAISGVAGGAVICSKKEWNDQLQKAEQSAVHFSKWTIMRFLEYPRIYAFCRPLYGIWIGKALLALAKKLRLLVPILTTEEKDGKADPLLHKIPNACAALALDQLRRLKQINDHRRMLTDRYLEACAEHGWPVLHGINAHTPLQKFPIFFADAKGVRRKLRSKNIHLDDGWCGCVVCPWSAREESSGYQRGGDPHAEEACEEILSLPTHPGITKADAEKLIKNLKKLLP